MDKHRTLLGALFVALGLSGLLGMAAVLMIFSIGSAALGMTAAHDSSVPAVLSLLPLSLGLFICLAVAVSTVPSLIAGYGLLRNRSWARAWAMIAGILNVPGIPFGTGVAIYAFWVLLHDESHPA